LFETLNKSIFPWKIQPKLNGDVLSQHAYLFRRLDEAVENNSLLVGLDNICNRIGSNFGCKIESVYCNRVASPTHEIYWHRDSYHGETFVLSFGGTRTVEWRVDKSGKIHFFRPSAGDLYLIPTEVNSTHHHRVCAGGDDDNSIRISLAFTFKP